MKKTIITLLLCAAALPSIANERNLILVTIDGLRWQEVFNGKQQALIEDKILTKHVTPLIQTLTKQNSEQAKHTLMPFIWDTVAQQGTLIGDRNKGSKMSVSNNWHFSYPGYSEIFTGVANDSLNSNNKVPNPEVSFVEWLYQQQGYSKAAAFGSWDVFPYIFNTERSKLYVNAGFDDAMAAYHSEQANLLNALQREIPSPWHNVRLDSFTHRFALDYLEKNKPKVLVISYGETDDFAHDGHYDQYLSAAHRTDNFLADLWQKLQQMPEYANNTNLLIVTDHGRGKNKQDWQHHASAQAVKSYMKGLKQFKEGVQGSAHIWMAAIGPDIKTKGLLTTEHEIYQKQVAATALTLLGQSPNAFNPDAGAAIKELL
ncbi:hypothetical protein tinsulaeT_01230 [Thalassotalea insulae]|uniref:Phosphoglyceromutase n=1 Tax=Thalassotalea insulae TaxID=2056778 RepID=A0ABQ6GLB0_9GAMM|nr:alkaline phosphatase family protein [Thalassotalea insulae]GLX76783.1 hypothetical protein tinsulaeT_01230 [Thalassotalea insulae]